MSAYAGQSRKALAGIGLKQALRPLVRVQSLFEKRYLGARRIVL
jgi:hypothetical protein